MLKKGDLLFTNYEETELGTIISEIGESYGYCVNHNAVYLGNEKVIEAIIPNGVREGSLNDFIKANSNPNQPCKMSVKRLKDQTNIDLFITTLKSFLGKPYNYTFDKGLDSFYCSSLVLESLKISYPKIVWSYFPMTFKNKKGLFYPLFINLYKGAENIPEGALGSHPARLFLMQDFELIHDYQIHDYQKTK